MFEKGDTFSADLHPIWQSEERFFTRCSSPSKKYLQGQGSIFALVLRFIWFKPDVHTYVQCQRIAQTFAILFSKGKKCRARFWPIFFHRRIWSP
jgi:hypothetical protein